MGWPGMEAPFGGGRWQVPGTSNSSGTSLWHAPTWSLAVCPPHPGSQASSGHVEDVFLSPKSLGSYLPTLSV